MHKMLQSFRSLLLTALFMGLPAAFAQETVALSGKVIDQNGAGLRGVLIELGNLSANTDSLGNWSIQGQLVSVQHSVRPHGIRWFGRTLITQFEVPTLVSADLFDASGRRLATLPTQMVLPGQQNLLLSLPQSAGARWLRVQAGNTSVVLSANSGVMAPQIAMPPMLARTSGVAENLLIYSLQGQVITEDRLPSLIAAGITKQIQEYLIGGKLLPDSRVTVNAVWALFQGGAMKGAIRKASIFYKDSTYSGRIYTVKSDSVYTFRTWINVLGNGNHLTAVSDTTEFSTQSGVINSIPTFTTSNAFPDGKILAPDSVEAGTTLNLSVLLDATDTSKHRILAKLTKAEWDLDGNGFHDSGLVTKATVRWLVPGAHTVKLRLTDTNTNVSIISKVIRVVNTGAAIQLVGVANPTITPSDSLTFQLMVRDTSGVASIIWDFGDGTTKTTTGTHATITHSYPGTSVVKPDSTKIYPLLVTVVDELGGRTTQTVAQVTVVNATPKGTVTGPTAGLVNKNYTFHVAVAPAGKQIARAEWDLGDGTWVLGSDTGRTVQWTAAGPYTVRVKLTDKDSNTVILVARSIKIAVGNTPSTISVIRDTIITPSDEVLFSVTVNDPDGVAKVLWDFGDGQTGITSGASPIHSIAHTYPGVNIVPVNSAKRYPLTLRIVDGLGDTTRASAMVVDSNDMPIITRLPKDTSLPMGSTIHLNITGKDLGYLFYFWSNDGISFKQGNADTTISLPSSLNDNYWIYAMIKDGDNNVRRDSIRIRIVRDARALEVAGGEGQTLILRYDSTVWASGLNEYGQLGDSTSISKTQFIQVAEHVKSIAAGYDHSLILKNDGTVWGAGLNYYGQIGDSTYTVMRKTFVRVASDVKSISAGEKHSLILKNDGTVWATGWNTYGQLGDSTIKDKTNRFVQVATDAKSISASSRHSLVLKNDGSVWAAGENTYGALGKAGIDIAKVFVQVATDIQTIAAGEFHSLVIKNDGSVWASGWNGYGQLGLTPGITYETFSLVSTNAKSISTSPYHTLILNNDASLLGTGDNEDGQLGDLTNIDRTSLTPVATGVSHISAGWDYSIIIKADGTAWATGNNDDGQLGDGTTDSRNTFKQISF